MVVYTYITGVHRCMHSYDGVQRWSNMMVSREALLSVHHRCLGARELLRCLLHHRYGQDLVVRGEEEEGGHAEYGEVLGGGYVGGARA